MQKIKMVKGVTLTFEEGCNKYLENCRQRNLREGTINHYRQSYRTEKPTRWLPLLFLCSRKYQESLLRRLPVTVVPSLPIGKQLKRNLIVMYTLLILTVLGRKVRTRIATDS